MPKFCGKCGSPLDERGKCPNCQPVESASNNYVVNDNNYAAETTDNTNQPIQSTKKEKGKKKTPIGAPSVGKVPQGGSVS